jgi:single-stranded DNA-binding protein
MADINKVLVSGTINRIGLGWLSNGKPELQLNLSLTQDGGFTLYLQVCVYGKDCERLAETLEVGMWVMIDGKLSWRTSIKGGVKESKMVVTTFGVDILTPPSEPVATRSDDAEGDTSHDEPAHRPEPKPRRRGYPKQALQDGGFSSN